MSRRIMMGVVVISASLLFLIFIILGVAHTLVKVETNLESLPGTEMTMDSPKTALEVIIKVTATDEIFLNKRGVSEADLERGLRKQAQYASELDAKLMVTIEAEEDAKYERVVDVLNILAKAKISNVTFTVDDGQF